MADTSKRVELATSFKSLTEILLTWDVGRCLKATKDVWVNVNGQILLVNELLVSWLNALLCPVCKRSIDQRISKIDEPLAWYSFEVLFVWQILPSLRIAHSFFEELFNAKTFILRYRQVSNSVAVDELPLPLNQLLQKVDGMTLVWCQVCTTLDCQEVVPIKMLSKAYNTYTSRFERNFDANILAVTCCLARASLSSTILNRNFILIKLGNALN